MGISLRLQICKSSINNLNKRCNKSHNRYIDSNGADASNCVYVRKFLRSNADVCLFNLLRSQLIIKYLICLINTDSNWVDEIKSLHIHIIHIIQSIENLLFTITNTLYKVRVVLITNESQIIIFDKLW